MVGFWQFTGGFAAEVICIIYITQDLSIIYTIYFSAKFGLIAHVDNFYAAALPPDNPMSAKKPTSKVTLEKVYMEDEYEKEHVVASRKW